MNRITKLKALFFNKNFLAFLIIGVINAVNGIVFATVYAMFINTNVAFIVGYITSLSISYVLNSSFNFKERLQLSKYIKFCISYVPNFVIQNLFVVVFFNILQWPKLIVFVMAAIIGVPITYLCIKLFVFFD
ncbi:GtrA family protein [Clostridium sp. 'deep sea']|uniref:GtrA family protein n=1 Tax=Clostridium sp. 'deep sea' TaxID=2779445 RepID=UPI0018966290|nr:GtrA family protein [Clostridium sp. 'deep sea']QOR36484.1 GtrA family protein [Clostridium sp. 'deep sea']